MPYRITKCLANIFFYLKMHQQKKCFAFSFKDVHSLSWHIVYPKCKDSKNILAVMDLVLSLPSHSADAERGFSEMKLIKTDWRSCLRPEVLSDLLFVLFHSAEIEHFDPIPAVNVWTNAGTRSRRPEIVPYGAREEDSDSDSLDPFLEMDPDYLDKLC